MPTLKVKVGPFNTPCGPLSAQVAIPAPLPGLPIPFPWPFPWKFKIPLPDCSALKRLASSAPEDPADSEP